MLAAFTGFLDDSGVTLLKGRRALQEGKQLPRITHIGLGGAVVDPDLVGEGKIVDPSTGYQSRDKIIRVRQFNILMVVHGQNEEQAEQLFHNAIAAWELACSGSLNFSDEEWPDQAEGSDGVNRRGNEIQAVLTVNLPVYAKSKPLTFLTNWAEEGMFTVGILYGNDNTYGSNYMYNPGEIVC